MKRECVRREIVKKSHFVERKVSLCESVIISCNHWVGYSGMWSDTLFGVGYNLIIIFVIGKYFWDDSVDVRKRCRTRLNSCVSYYFSYGVIFVVFSRSFVGVGNFICECVDYPIVVSELWSRAHKGLRYCCLMEK